MSLSISKYRRWLLYLYSFTCVSLVAGLVYGWPALRRQLLEEGSQLGEKTLGAIFTIGAWSTQGGRFFTGLARDRFGTRSVIGVCFVIVISGTFGIAMSDPDNAVALAISLFAVGLGSGVQLCMQPVAGLFPKRSGTILSSLSGAFQVSGLVFLALTNGSNVTRKASFLAFSIALAVLGVGAVFLFPKGGSFVVRLDEGDDDGGGDDDGVNKKNSKVDDVTEVGMTETFSKQSLTVFKSENRLTEDESDNVLDREDKSDDMAPSEMVHGGPLQIAGEEEDPLGGKRKSSEDQSQDDDADRLEKETAKSEVLDTPTTTMNAPTALEQLKCLEYILLCLWFSVNIVPLQYYVGSIGFQLEEKGDDDGFYTNLFAIVYASAAFVAPVGGYLSDKAGLGVGQGVGTVLSAVSFLILSSDRIPLPGQGVGLACYGIGRMLVFGMFFSNIGKRFGYKNFGTLAGLGLLISAIISLLQYPLIAAAADGHASIVNVSCGIVLLCLIPYFFWLHRQEKQSRTTLLPA